MMSPQGHDIQFSEDRIEIEEILINFGILQDLFL